MSDNSFTSEPPVKDYSRFDGIDPQIAAEYIKNKYSGMEGEFQSKYASTIATRIRNVHERFKKLIPSLIQPDVDSEVKAEFHKWTLKDRDQIPSLDSIAKDERNKISDIYVAISALERGMTPETKERIGKLMSNFLHDTQLITIPVDSFFNDGVEEFKPFQNEKALEWVSHVFDRIARQMENKPVIEEIDYNERFKFLEEVFNALNYSDPNLKLEFPSPELIGNIPSIKGDKLYFEGIVFNLVRNAQNILKDRADKNSPAHIKVDLTEQDGNIVLKVSDNGKGFPDRLLEYTTFTDKDGNVVTDETGNPIQRQRALLRGFTEDTGGTGLGLDIVREFSEEHFKGKVELSNTNEEGKTGAIVTVTLPIEGHNTTNEQAAEPNPTQKNLEDYATIPT